MRLKPLWILTLSWSLGSMAQELPPSKTTLSLRGESLAQTLKQIEQQTGNPTTSRIVDPKTSIYERLFSKEMGIAVTMEAKDKPYWSVIHDLCEKHDLKIKDEWNGSESQVCLVPGDKGKPPTAIGGAMLAQITQLDVQRIQNFRYKPSSHINMQIKLYFEPQSRVIKCTQAPIIDQALSDAGESLVNPEISQDQSFFDVSRTFKFSGAIGLNYKPGIKLIKTLSGKFWVIQEVQSEEWVIETDKAVGQTKNCCDIDALKVAGLKLENGSIALDMEISSTTRNENLISSMQILGRIRYEGLEDLKIDSTQVSGVNTRIVDGKEVKVCRFETRAPSGIKQMPAKLILRIPAQVKALQVPFEFKDVEMP